MAYRNNLFIRPLGEFVLGALYEWAYSNGDEIRGLMPGFLKLDEKEEARLNARLNQSQAFELGRLLGEGAAVAQGIYEFIVGSAAVGGGGGLCITGVGCFAGAPAIATGAVLATHGGTLAVNSASEFGEKLRDILSPNRMASSGGADDVIGLSRETGLSTESINKVYGDVSPSDIRFLDDKLDKNLVESLFDKAKDTITNVTKTLKLVGDDVDAVQVTLRQNKRIKKNGELAINDNDLNTAFANTVEFLEQYKGKVSGAFANRFGRASSSELDFVQAKGELETARDILDGKTRLGNIDNIRGLREIYGQKNPEYFLEALDGSTRLIEVKTLTGKVERNLSGRLKNAIGQISGNAPITNPTKNGYIRLDYRNANSTNRQSNWWFNKIKNILEDTQEGSITPGIDVVEFVEVLYKNPADEVVNVIIKVENGVVKLLP